MSKKVEIKMEGKHFCVNVDPNQDGEPVVQIKVDVLEIPDEVIDAIFKK